MRDMGWNTIRLGVVWAGAQPRDEDALDPGFLELLHDVLDLTDANEIHVLLDNHGDMVGSAGKSMLSILLILIQHGLLVRNEHLFLQVVVTASRCGSSRRLRRS